MIDLREKDRKAICELAAQTFPAGTEIWAYGSRVKGTNHDASDLDLVVHFPQTQDQAAGLSQLTDFIDAPRDSTITVIVQVLAWHAIPRHFQSSIQCCYQMLWKAPANRLEP